MSVIRKYWRIGLGIVVIAFGRPLRRFRRDPRNSILACARTTQTLLPDPADNRCHETALLRSTARTS